MDLFCLLLQPLPGLVVLLDLVVLLQLVGQQMPQDQSNLAGSTLRGVHDRAEDVVLWGQQGCLAVVAQAMEGQAAVPVAWGLYKVQLDAVRYHGQAVVVLSGPNQVSPRVGEIVGFPLGL